MACRVYNRLMVAQTDGQQAVLEDIALSMDQVDVINRQIFPLMTRMIDGLEQSIAARRAVPDAGAS